MKTTRYVSGIIMLLLAAFFWGTTFIAQSDAMQKMGPFTFSALRSVIGAVFLVFVILLRKLMSRKQPLFQGSMKATVKGGIVCGTALFIATNLQNIGLIGAAPGKAAFITSLYILFVPIIGIFSGNRPSKTVLVCVLVSVTGFYMLNMRPEEGFGLTVWEIMVLLCALAFSMHIIFCDKYGRNGDTVLLSMIQFAVCALLSGIFIFADTLVLDYPVISFAILKEGWFSIIYAGLLSSGVAFTLQISGQKRVPAAAAVLLMSLESLFAVISAYIIAPESNALTAVQTVGCALIFISVCVSQLSFPKRNKCVACKTPESAEGDHK